MIEDAIKLEQISSLNLPAEDLIEADEEIVRTILAGDEAAFGLLFERYRYPVTRTVGRFFNRREIVEELVQQSFTKIYFSLKEFRGGRENSFAAWVSRLTINVCYDELRRCKRRPENVFAELNAEDAAYIEKIVEKNFTDNEKIFSNRDLAEKLLSGLDAKDRLALMLFHSEDFSISEVAEKIGWTESNVKVRLMRTRKYLRNLLDKFA